MNDLLMLAVILAFISIAISVIGTVFAMFKNEYCARRMFVLSIIFLWSGMMCASFGWPK